MNCQRCWKNPGEPYRIYYGKTLSRYTKDIGFGTKMNTTTYQVAGYEDVYLCKECTLRSTREVVKLVLFTVLILGMGFLCYHTIVSSWNDLLCIPFAIVGLGLIFFWLGSYFAIIGDLGDRLAKDLLRRKYENAGYDSFWNIREYAKLRNRM